MLLCVFPARFGRIRTADADEAEEGSAHCRLFLPTEYSSTTNVLPHLLLYWRLRLPLFWSRRLGRFKRTQASTFVPSHVSLAQLCALSTAGRSDRKREIRDCMGPIDLYG